LAGSLCPINPDARNALILQWGFMSLSRTHLGVIGSWIAFVVVAAVVASRLGYNLTGTTGLLALAIAIAAPVFLIMIFRAPERSTVEMIYDAEQSPASNPEKRS
jgi:multisubunit Na+/H+ antiporter MnhG subunit